MKKLGSFLAMCSLAASMSVVAQDELKQTVERPAQTPQDVTANSDVTHDAMAKDETQHDAAAAGRKSKKTRRAKKSSNKNDVNTDDPSQNQVELRM